MTEIDEKMGRFLALVPAARFRSSPKFVWAEQARNALSDGLIKIGWGGVLELTEYGRSTLKTYRKQAALEQSAPVDKDALA